MAIRSIQRRLARCADSVTARNIITSGNQTLSGVVSDVSYPVDSSRLVQLHFAEATGASSFVNGTLYGFDGNARLAATCSGDSCPNAAVGGPSGSAVQFAGSNDYLALPAVLNPADGPFTAMAWFNVESCTTTRYILQQTDGSDPGRSWLYVLPNGQLGTFLGGTGMQNAYVQDNIWQHVEVSSDGAKVRLYLNGKLPISANDENLTETGWRCPVDDTYCTAIDQDATWYTARITDSQVIVELTTSEEIVTVEPNPSITACDLYGQCTTATADVAVLEAIAAAQGGAQAVTVSAAAIAADAGTSVSVYSVLQLVNTPIDLSTSFAAFDSARHTAT